MNNVDCKESSLITFWINVDTFFTNPDPLESSIKQVKMPKPKLVQACAPPNPPKSKTWLLMMIFSNYNIRNGTLIHIF